MNEEYENLCKLHLDASNFLFDIVYKLNCNNENNEFLCDIWENHIKCSKNLDVYKNKLKLLKNELLKYRITNRKNKNQKFKSRYNSILNYILMSVKPNSKLNDLCFLNGHFKLISKSSPKIKNREDILTLETKNTDNITLKLSQGRLFFENKEHLLSCLLVYIEKCTINDIIVDNFQTSPSTKNVLWGIYNFDKINQVNGFTLNIKFPHSKNMIENTTQFYSTINSSSTKILHLLCGGYNLYNINDFEMGFEKKIKFKEYYKFQQAVRKKIEQLIRSGFNTDFPYTIVDCIRTHPIKCSRTNIVLKKGKSKKIRCKCSMDLCSGGCCRIYHGETNCLMTLDEASDQIIKNLSEKCSCPNCKNPIIKIDGCNHMTCICKTQFCYLCKEEFKTNEHGKYMIEEHYSDNEFGRLTGAVCKQF